MTEQNGDGRLPTKPVFFTSSGLRWKAFVGAFRLFIAVMIAGGTVLAFAVYDQSSVILPKLTSRNEVYRKVLNPDALMTLKTEQNAEYRKLRTEVAGKAASERAARPRRPRRPPLANQERGAFLVSWDPGSLTSLRRHADKLTVVYPEWIFLDSDAKLVFKPDEIAQTVIRRAGLKTAPMLSNFWNDEWGVESLKQLLSSPARRLALVNELSALLEERRAAGLMLDLEQVPSELKDEFTDLVSALSVALTAKHMTLTVAVPVADDAYDLRRIGDFADRVMVMAYDLHYSSGPPGPVADHKWVEETLDSVTSLIPPGKVLLGIPGYGYDWPKDSEARDLTYQDAILTAKESEADIGFDNDTYNLSFEYTDENDYPHTVWFVDAATSFNALRAAADFGVAGAALWRLGSEDERIWTFFGRDMSSDSLINAPFDLSVLKETAPTEQIEFEGKGEVLDIVATPEAGDIQIEYDREFQLIAEQFYHTLPSAYVVRKRGSAEKKLVLTFDDGPDETYTPEILDILAREHVPATFFIVGVAAERNLALLKRIFDEGHELGNHTFTHANLAVVSLDRVSVELNATRRLIECITGHSTVLFRPPYDADSEPSTPTELISVAEAKRQNYLTVGESIDPRDWEHGVSAEEIVRRTEERWAQGNIVLLHDAGGDRSETVRALPMIIKLARERGYEFTTVAGLLGKTRQDVMPRLASPFDVSLSRINWGIAQTASFIQEVFVTLFFIAIALSVSRSVVIALLAFIQHRRSHTLVLTSGERPLVSVLVPAYNEQVNAVRTVEKILKSSYESLEVVFIDDGSTDSTFERVSSRFADNPQVRVFQKENGGKASALNYGSEHAHGEYLVCIDADTLLHPNAVHELLAAFTGSDVSAVAGNVRVGNEKNMLTRWQSLEYVTSQNFDRRAFDLLNCITVIPGAIGAFRKSEFLRAGGFESDTLAEDCDLTIRILKSGGVIRSSHRALAYTEAPEKLRMFMKQRFRWTFGTMQNVWKHRDALFRREHGSLGLVALPNALLFQFFLPAIAPFADLVMLFSLATGNWRETVPYYLAFLAIELATGFIAFYFESQPYRKLWLLIPQRLVYRQLLSFILIKSVLSALKGRLVQWGVLTRTGSANFSLRDFQRASSRVEKY